MSPRARAGAAADADPDAVLREADALYALPPDRFTPARDERASALRADDPDLSAAVKALRKPVLAAWVVDLLVRREAEQVAQAVEVGEALRRAAEGMDATELRALTVQRRRLTAALTTRARALAREEGHRTTESVAEQVEATLTAAMLDAGAAAAVRSGLLVQPLRATGVDAVDAAAAVALPAALGSTATPRAAEPPPRPELRVVPDPEADAKARRAAEEALAEATEAETAARHAHEEALAAVEHAEARSLQVAAEVDELRRRLAEAEERLEGIDDELAEAEDAAADAADALADATTAREEAATALQAL